MHTSQSTDALAVGVYSLSGHAVHLRPITMITIKG
jgi:hypothetical protein